LHFGRLRPASGGTRISLVAVGFIAPIAGWLVDRRDPGVAPQATQVTSNVCDQGSRSGEYVSICAPGACPGRD
jgi:hypothetical protein